MSGKLYFEDFALGQQWRYGDYLLEREEMVDFARAYDPEPFHLSTPWSEHDGEGDIIGSGLLTIAIWRRLDHEHFTPLGAQFIAGLGFEYLRFLSPTEPGDRLHVLARCIDKRASASRPDRGIVRFRCLIRNERDMTLVDFAPNVMVRRRGGGTP